MSESLQKIILQWYHTLLYHPGETRIEQNIRQHFTFKGLRPMIKQICGKCKVCQKSNKHTTKYGLLSEKEAQVVPWEIISVDLIGPYTVTGIHVKNLLYGVVP